MKIVWNKVTPFSKWLALIIFIVFPFAGFWLGIQYGEVLGYLNSSNAPAVGNDYYSNVAVWQTATGNQGGFTIAYPLDFPTDQNYSPSPSADWRMDANGVNGITYFTLTVPSAFEPQTNFAGAKLTVGASANNVAVANCLAPDANGGPAQATTTAVVNGITFTVFHAADAGAGNYYQTTSYRTLHAGQCYAVEYTIHSSQIGNYPPEYQLHPFDEAQIASVLDRIVGTFRFQ